MSTPSVHYNVPPIQAHYPLGNVPRDLNGKPVSSSSITVPNTSKRVILNGKVQPAQQKLSSEHAKLYNYMS